MSRMGPKESPTYEEALSYTFTLLSRRSYSKAELRERLARRGTVQMTIERVLARLEELKYVDDEAFADMIIRDRGHRKGPHALRRDLQQKGVAELLIEEKLAAIDENEQLAVARGILAKESWRLRGEARRRRAKAMALLARRGFDSEVAALAIEGFDDWQDD